MPIDIPTVMIRYATFPVTWAPPAWVERIVEVFRRNQSRIATDPSQGMPSGEAVLAVLAGDLEALGFRIEKVSLADLKRARGRTVGGNAAAGHYHVDVYHAEWHCCVAIEVGAAWTNDAIDADAVEPMLVANADTLCLAVPGGHAVQSDATESPGSEYDCACTLARAVYGRTRAHLPRRLVLIGY